jgi:hypothetical protein
MSLVLQSSGGGSVTLNEPTTASNFTQDLPAVTGNVVIDSATQTLTNKTLTSPTIGGTPTGVGVLTSGTAVDSTSGTSIDFTSIPSWVKRVTVNFSGVSTNGTSDYLIQLGTSGGIQSSGYVGTSTYVGGPPASINFNTGFSINTGLSSITMQGSLTFSLLNSATGTWCLSAVLGNGDVNYVRLSAGSKTLSGTLDRLRITTVNGTDTYDAGSINILYE